MEEKRFINGQQLAPYNNMPFLGHTVGQIGCGPLAVYNLIAALGGEPDLDGILRYCEKYPLMSMWGAFGTNTITLAMYLKKKGYRTALIMYPTFALMERIVSKYGSGIINYFHGKGAHYICVRRTSSGYEIFNSGNHFGGVKAVRSLRDLRVPSRMFLPLSILYVKEQKQL